MTNSGVVVLSILMSVAACGGAQHPEPAGLGAKAPSYVEFHNNFAPGDKNPDGSGLNLAVQHVEPMSAAEAVKGLGELLRGGSDDQMSAYVTVMSGISRYKTGPIVDALPADLQSRGVNALPDDVAIEVMFYVSEGTYTSIAGRIAAFKIYKPLEVKAPDDPSYAGDYELVSVDGKPLPYQSPGSGVWTLDQQTLRIRADGGWTTTSDRTGDGSKWKSATAGTYWTAKGKVELRKMLGKGLDYWTLEPTPPDTLTWNEGGRVPHVFKKK